MAFSYTRGYQGIPRARIAWGTYTNGAADTGGTISTGLREIYFASCSPNSHVQSAVPKYTVSGGSLVIVTDVNADGYWFAIGL